MPHGEVSIWQKFRLSHLNISDAAITHICVLLPFWGCENLHEKKNPTKIALHTSIS